MSIRCGAAPRRSFLSNTLKSAEGNRHDAAYELGRLVLHKHGAQREAHVEREAGVLAAAFLMRTAAAVASRDTRDSKIASF